MSNGEIFGHLTFAALIFLMLPLARIARPVRVAAFLSLLGLAFLPMVSGLSPGDYVRSYTDDLAITTLVWLLWTVFVRLTGVDCVASRHHVQLAACFALLAVVLYPATLGLASLDPYRLGFSPLSLLVAMWLLCLWLWWQRNHLGLALIVIATLAWWLDVKDSDNYWDYLVDPALGVYALGYLLYACLRRRSGARATP